MIKRLLAQLAMRYAGIDELYWVNPAGWEAYMKLAQPYQTRADVNLSVKAGTRADAFGQFIYLVTISDKNGVVQFEDEIEATPDEANEYINDLLENWGKS